MRRVVDRKVREDLFVLPQCRDRGGVQTQPYDLRLTRMWKQIRFVLPLTWCKTREIFLDQDFQLPTVIETLRRFNRDIVRVNPLLHAGFG